MTGYSQFVNQLETHLDAHKHIPYHEWRKESALFLNGLAAEELRRLVNLEKRREYGAFFTNNELAIQLFSNSEIVIGSICTVYDPAVGAGNLLIAANNYLRQKAHKITLLGTDLHSEFIEATKLRLMIANLLAERTDENVSLSSNLLVADGMNRNHFYTQATHIVINPPFNLMDGDKSINWGKGKLSSAAVFIDRVIRHVRPGTQIIAILPEVLRGGSRYEKWRTLVDNNCIVGKPRFLGQFDKYTNIDVFSIVLTKKTKPTESDEGHVWNNSIKAKKIVGDLFSVSVGNVVDNRDPNEGVSYPFVVSRGLVGWKEVTKINRNRKFQGRSISGPFIVIKRTSRMGDKHRAVAAIINLAGPAYVDNHLIVLKPISGKLKDCRSLLKVLETSKTDTWIDEQIRCRHLTVKIVSRIPL